MQELETLIANARAQGKDLSQRQEAFAELVGRFQDVAYSWACHTLGDWHLAQDAVQEAFVVAYQKLDQLREPKAFPGWLRQIVFSQCHRITRRKQLPTSSIDATVNLPSTDPDPAVTVEDMELRDKVLAAIQALPERERVVTKLFYFNGYSQKEIARLLEVPVTTVKKRLQYARTNLKGILVAMFDTFAPPVQAVPKPVPVPVTSSPRRPVRRRHF